MVALRRDTEHDRALGREQLDDDGSDSTCRGRYHDDVALASLDSSYRGVGRAPDYVHRAGDLPTQLRRLTDQLGDRNCDILGVTRASPRPAKNLVPKREVGDRVTDSSN